jgi:hypothetical protein
MNKSIKVIPFPDIEHAYLVISARRNEHDPEWVKVMQSFVYMEKPTHAIEWEPEHGPIQTWLACDETDDGAESHWMFPYHNTPPGSWSQLAVYERGLPEAYLRGDFRYIFSVLRDWWVSRDCFVLDEEPGA